MFIKWMDYSTEFWFRNPSHSNVYVRLAFVYSSGKCMSHKSRPMLQKNPNMARNSKSRNYYFGKQIIKFSWSWWLAHVTVPNPNQSTKRIVCLDNHVFLGPLKNSVWPKPPIWFWPDTKTQTQHLALTFGG